MISDVDKFCNNCEISSFAILKCITVSITLDLCVESLVSKRWARNAWIWTRYRFSELNIPNGTGDTNTKIPYLKENKIHLIQDKIVLSLRC
jgi:hypothetical protein